MDILILVLCLEGGKCLQQLMSVLQLYLPQAMKVENMLKIKEEFDYKSLSRRFDIQLDKLILENERQQKVFEEQIERNNIRSTKACL